MSPQTIFNLHLVLGYVAWLLCFGTYLLPRLRSMSPVDTQRAIATLHSFRFFGLVFLVPGVVGSLPTSLPRSPPTGTLQPGCWRFGAPHGKNPSTLLAVCRGLQSGWNRRLVLDYYHAVRVGLPAMAGQLGATYAIPILYVPLLMITHITAFYFLLLRPQVKTVEAVPSTRPTLS